MNPPILSQASIRDPRISRGGQRFGFTLLELLLVMTILVAFLSITWPSIDRLYGDHQLKQSALDLQNLLAATRYHSIDTGIQYQFRYEPQGRFYVAVPYERDNLEQNGDSGDKAAGTVSGWMEAGQLPEHVRFEQVSGDDRASEQIPVEFLAGLPNSADLAAVAWSSAIIFYPDGSATSSSLDIVDEKSQYIRLTLRGLTGVPSTSRVGLREEK